jgi:hypothetical protein
MPELFNVHGFGPPGRFTVPSTWPWVDHLVSGLPHTTHFALFRLAFASAPCRKHLALPYTTSRRPIMQKVRGQPRPKAIGLPQFVGTWFQVLLTPLEGVLFTFQSPYLCSIGRAGVLSLAGWAPHVQSEFHELRPTRPPPLG